MAGLKHSAFLIFKNMKKILTTLILFLSIYVSAQNNILHAGESDWPNNINEENSNQNEFKSSQIMSCAANTILTTGYPAWTNYYAGYMFKVINTSTCSILVNCFEARFQGTSGYRIYTKTGTFIGFETLPGSWTLVGSVAGGVTGISTTTCSPIPIAVGVVIPAGGSQSFYLTRTDNVVANRHLYITGSGTAGTTIYASDANVQITEAEYLDVYFLLQIGVRRPSFDMYYDKICGVLPIELVSFIGESNVNYNQLDWITATELNNEYFILERSEDGLNWTEIGKINGSGTSHTTKKYSFKDYGFKNDLNYYRLLQVDYNGARKKSGLIVVDNKKDIPTIIRTTNLIGQEISGDFEGLKFIYYSDGSVKKKVN